MRPWLFAVEDSAVQVTWRAGTFEPGTVRLRAADTTVDVVCDGGPGGVVLDDLPPATTLTVRAGTWRRRVTTLAPPPGEELYRFATVSDLHIGADRFGYLGTLREHPTPPVAHPERAARRALADLEAWGAQRVLVKGDLTNRGTAEQWRRVAELLAASPVPAELLPGNHDVWYRGGGIDPWEALADLGHGLTRHHQVVDVPGLRIVLADSCVPGHDRGRLGYLADPVAEALAARPDVPGFVAMHHYPQRLRIPTFLPPGIPAPDARPFLEAVARAQPATVISSGHTHRHRRRHVGPLLLTEVGSTKDYPGTWAGYVVHEGGIRQVVRRLTGPEILPWLDHSARAALGAWGRWSPGLLRHRCFSHPWPARS